MTKPTFFNYREKKVEHLSISNIKNKKTNPFSKVHLDSNDIYIKTLDCVCISDIQLSDGICFIEIELVDKENREYMLKNALQDVKHNYDYIIIDCAPSLGLITLNSLVAADSVIIPIQCEYFALEGLGKLLNTIKSVQKLHNPTLDIEGLLLTMFDSRLRLSNQVVDEVQKHFSTMVFDTIIRRNTRLGEAPSYGESIIAYDATSKGAVNYLNLANELLKKNKYYGKS